MGGATEGTALGDNYLMGSAQEIWGGFNGACDDSLYKANIFNACEPYSYQINVAFSGVVCQQEWRSRGNGWIELSVRHENENQHGGVVCKPR